MILPVYTAERGLTRAKLCRQYGVVSYVYLMSDFRSGKTRGEMKITTVITCYESTTTIGLTLMSLFGQTRRPDEIIVTDDGSTEATCNFVKRTLATISQSSGIKSGIITHKRTTPYRLNTIRNNGIQKASGNLVFLVDGDILVPRDFLLEHEKVHEKVMSKSGSALVSCVRKNITHAGEVEEGRKSAWGLWIQLVNATHYYL